MPTLHTPEVRQLAERITEHPILVDLKGKEHVPETVHHVLVRADALVVFEVVVVVRVVRVVVEDLADDLAYLTAYLLAEEAPKKRLARAGARRRSARQQLAPITPAAVHPFDSAVCCTRRCSAALRHAQCGQAMSAQKPNRQSRLQPQRSKTPAASRRRRGAKV